MSPTGVIPTSLWRFVVQETIFGACSADVAEVTSFPRAAVYKQKVDQHELTENLWQ